MCLRIMAIFVVVVASALNGMLFLQFMLLRLLRLVTVPDELHTGSFYSVSVATVHVFFYRDVYFSPSRLRYFRPECEMKKLHIQFDYDDEKVG